jgi:methylmalonyl-CoA mutase cobalamin-binding subunit
MSDTSRIESLAAGERLTATDDLSAQRGHTMLRGGHAQESEAATDAYLSELFDAAVSPSIPDFDKVVSRMTQAGIGVDEIADRFIPEVARKLGDMWCDDDMGFATVTIGVARLQGLLRDIGPEWRAGAQTDGDAPGVLVVVASDVFHTLGAMVVTGQLRRRGLSVRLMMGATPENLGPALRQARFDAVLISASVGESLESLRRLVMAAKKATSSPPPVVIGGTVLDQESATGADLAALTGADLVTRDLMAAIAFCGLTYSVRNGTNSGQ